MRTAEFDREKVLRSAMEIFISKGYSNTSLQDLKKATGLHTGSIYCAFDNKRGLLLAALEQYGLDQKTKFLTLFKDAENVISGLKSYLDIVVEECEREEIQDCLLQRALSELSHQDKEVERIISVMLNEWKNRFTDKILLAQQKKEISNKRNSEELSQFLVMGIYGIRTLSHTRPEKGTLSRLSNELLKYIQS